MKEKDGWYAAFYMFVLIVVIGIVFAVLSGITMMFWNEIISYFFEVKAITFFKATIATLALVMFIQVLKGFKS